MLVEISKNRWARTRPFTVGAYLKFRKDFADQHGGCDVFDYNFNKFFDNLQTLPNAVVDFYLSSLSKKEARIAVKAAKKYPGRRVLHLANACFYAGYEMVSIYETSRFWFDCPFWSASAEIAESLKQPWAKLPETESRRFWAAVCDAIELRGDEVLALGKGWTKWPKSATLEDVELIEFLSVARTFTADR